MKKPIIALVKTYEDIKGINFENKVFDSKIINTTINCQDILEFNGCVFNHVSFINIDKIIFIDCQFDSCDLSNNDMTSTLFLRVEILNSKLMGIEAIASKFDNVLISKCLINYCNFAQSIFKETIMETCNMGEIYLSEISCKNFVLKNCEVKTMELFNSDLKTFDISSSMINNMLINENSIKGITCSSEQALKLVPLLGIIIK